MSLLGQVCMYEVPKATLLWVALLARVQNTQ